MAIEFLTTANAEFLNMQSGNVRPYFYVEMLVSGVTSVLGNSYGQGALGPVDNWLIDGGIIDRERPILPGERSNIFSADVTIKCDNSTQRFSPDVTGSVFYNNDYLESPVNYWCGFISGTTAVLIQRGAFVLEDLRLDSRGTSAYMRLRDKFKRPLSVTIGRDVSGTATELMFTGQLNVKTVIESLLITGAGLTAGDIDIQTALVGLNNISFSEQSIAQALSLVSEAADGYMYSSRNGRVTFRDNVPIFGTATVGFTATESNSLINLFWEQTKDDRLSEIIVDFQSGADASVVAISSQTANSKLISNDAIQSTADAIALATRMLDRFSGQVTRIEFPSVYLPSVEIGDKISVYSTAVGLLGKRFDLYKIQEEPTEGTMRLFLINEDRSTGKWAFFSHQTGAAGAGEHSAVFAGSGASQSGGWAAGWGFFSRETGTAVNPGFDLDGDNDNILESGVTSSGTGGTGIEVPFMFY